MKKVGSDLKVHLLSPVQTSLTSRLQYYGIVLLSSKDMLLPRWVYLKSTISCHSYSQKYTPMDLSFLRLSFLICLCWPAMYADEPVLKETGRGLPSWAKDACWQRWKSGHPLVTHSCQQVRVLERLCPCSFLMLNNMGLACSSLCWRDQIKLYSRSRVLKLLGKNKWWSGWPLCVLNWNSELLGLRWVSTYDPWLFGACTWPAPDPFHSSPFLPCALSEFISLCLNRAFACLSQISPCLLNKLELSSGEQTKALNQLERVLLFKNLKVSLPLPLLPPFICLFVYFCM